MLFLMYILLGILLIRSVIYTLALWAIPVPGGKRKERLKLIYTSNLSKSLGYIIVSLTNLFSLKGVHVIKEMIPSHMYSITPYDLNRLGCPNFTRKISEVLNVFYEK